MADQTSTKDKLARYGQRAQGWLLLGPGEMINKAAGLDRRTLAWGAIGLGAVLLLCFNLLTSMLFRNVKADLTQERLFTISSGTKSVLRSIDEPISVRVYYTKKLGEVAPVFGKYFERVKALLEQYRDISGGKLQVTFIDPDASPDAEDRATSSGLKSVRINQEGELGYFGLVASNTTDNDAVVEFFSPDRERYLEYDLTKLVNGLSVAKKRVVGLIAGLPVEGGMNPMQPMRQPMPAWTSIEQIREFFEIKTIEMSAIEIPPGIDVLLLIQPSFISPELTYAIDQFVLGGGRVLAFVDPHVEASPMGQPGMPQPMGDNVVKLLKSWGVAIDIERIVGDPNNARRVQFGGRGGRGGQVAEYLGWLQIPKALINEKDPLAASIEKLQLASAGSITKVDGATTVLQPIVQTSAMGGLIETDKIRFQPDPLTILRGFKPGGVPLTVATRIGGDTKSAFPDGRPKPEEKKDEKADDKTLNEKIADKVREAKSKELADKAKTEPPKPHLAAGKVNVVLVSDADFLHDNFWVEMRDFLGQQIAVPQAHNAVFLVNALEQLAGGSALADLRGRGISERPFDRVVELRRSAEQRFRQKEEGLVAKLKDIQEKLSKVEVKGGGDGAAPTVLLSEKDRQTIDTFKSEMISTRRELREVKSALRHDIDRLDQRMKFLNIAVVPILIGFGGLAVAWMRRRRGRAIA